MPFFMKAGKALGERKAEVRIQFRNSSHLLHGKKTEGMRNELVVRALVATPTAPNPCIPPLAALPVPHSSLSSLCFRPTRWGMAACAQRHGPCLWLHWALLNPCWRPWGT